MKLGFVNANKMPLKGHENILVFYKKLPTYNPQKYFTTPTGWGTKYQKEGRYKGYSGGYKDSIYKDTGERFPHDVVKFSNWNGGLPGFKGDKGTIHPCQKPIELLSWLIRSYSNEGETIFDGFMGGGSTGISCIETKRIFIGAERDKDIFQNAKKRIKSKL
jgi:site-specific DNA-methyltransferase (adenine-specific)